jgi:hypothetical protein
MRQGLAGWVANHREPIMNGDPSVEYGADLWVRPTVLKAALAAPLTSPGRMVGVVGLYRKGHDSFNRNELKTLELLAFRLSECVSRDDEQTGLSGFLQGLEEAVKDEQAPSVLVRLDVEGNLAPAQSFGVIRELFPPEALMLELRRHQFVVLVKSELAPSLGNTAREILARLGAQLHVGWAMVEAGVQAGDLLTAAERALMESKQQQGIPFVSTAQSLVGLHAAITAHQPAHQEMKTN